MVLNYLLYNSNNNTFPIINIIMDSINPTKKINIIHFNNVCELTESKNNPKGALARIITAF